MNSQVWVKGSEYRILRPEPRSDYYVEWKCGDFWITGVSHFWLVSNGWEQI